MITNKEKEFHRPAKAPFEILLGIEVLQVRKDSALAKLPFREELTNPHRSLYGGAIASLVDCVSAIALTTRFEEGNFFTVKFDLKFKNLARTDIFAESRITGSRKNFYFIEVKITDTENNLIAEAKTTFFVSSTKRKG